MVFDDMITGMEANKKFSPMVTESFLSTYFKVLKTIRLNATHYFIIKLKQEGT